MPRVLSAAGDAKLIGRRFTGQFGGMDSFVLPILPVFPAMSMYTSFSRINTLSRPEIGFCAGQSDFNMQWLPVQYGESNLLYFFYDLM